MNLQGMKDAGSQFLNACQGLMLQHPLPIIAGGAAVTVAIICVAKRQLISQQVTRAYTCVYTNVYRKFMDSSKKAKIGMVVTAVAVIAVVAVGVLAVRKKQAATLENSTGAGIPTLKQNPVPAADIAKEADPVVESTSKDPVSAKEAQNKKEAVKEKEKEKEKEVVKEPVAEKELPTPMEKPVEKPVEKVEKEAKKEDKKPAKKKPTEKAPVVKEKQEDVVAKPTAEEKPAEPAQPAIAEEKPASAEPVIAEGTAPMAATGPAVIG